MTMRKAAANTHNTSSLLSGPRLLAAELLCGCPNILVCNAELTARQIVSGGVEQWRRAIGATIADLMFYTVADATVGVKSYANLRVGGVSVFGGNRTHR